MRFAKLTAAMTIAAMLTIPGCSGSGSSTIGRSAVSAAKESRAESGRHYAIGPQFEAKLEEMISREVSALGIKESVPMELNRQVLLNISYFLNDARGFMTSGLSRGSKYIPMMKAIFRQKGLPEDLVYLALIESGFRNDAVSHASAVGPWQFITATGRRYGLTINDWVDERRDPVKSTYAAADYLTTLHDMFNSWPLAIAAYNSGEGKIMKGIKNYGVSNFWDMSSVGGHLAEETKLYVPSFLAATFIAKDPAAYGLTIDVQPPDRWDEVVIPAPITLKEAASMCGHSADKLAELNPHLLKGALPPDETNFVLRIPAGSTDKFAKAYGKSSKGRGTAEAAHQHIAQKGETVESVAALYMIEADQLRQSNNLSGSKLKEGTKLTLPPQSAIAAARPLERKPQIAIEVPAAASPRLSSITHKVKAGDTLGSVAKLYGVSIDSIKKNNKLTGTTVRTGQILKIKSDLPLTAEAKSSSPLMVVESKAPPRVSDTHTVAAGESLGVIAKKYGMSVRELADINEIKGVTINVDQKLKISRPGDAANGQRQAPAAKSEPERPIQSGGDKIHTVKAGDSLGVLAQKYGSTSKAIAAANNLTGINIRIGQKLKIPGQGSASLALAAEPAKPASAAPQGGVDRIHTVETGDSLGVLAQKYGTTSKAIMEANNLADHNIRIGQKLKIPGQGQASAAQAAETDKPASSSQSGGGKIHIVETGDSLGVLAQKYGTTSKAIMEANNLPDHNIRIGQKLKIPGQGQASTVQAAAMAKPAPAAQGGIHVVQSGESLSVIAQKYGLTTKALAEMNNITDNNIRIGQKLKVSGGKPAGQAASSPAGGGSGVYTVASGDTIYSIARKNNLPVADLKKLNNIGDDNTIRMGQKLKIK